MARAPSTPEKKRLGLHGYPAEECLPAIASPCSGTARPPVVMMEVGDRVVVSERGFGTIVSDLGDGSWHVELNDGATCKIGSTIDASFLDFMPIAHGGRPKADVQATSPALSDCSLPGEGWLRQNIVLCFGDSLTEGLISFHCPRSPYSSRLSLRLYKGCANADSVPAAVLHSGVQGETTSHMARRFGDVLKFLCKATPGVVIILGGTNDLGDEPKDRVVENLLSLHAMANAAGAVTGVLTIPVCRYDGQEDYAKEDREYVNDKLRSFAGRQPDKSILVDVAAALPQGGVHADLWAGDGVHMSAKGYQALGDLVADALLPAAACSPAS